MYNVLFRPGKALCSEVLNFFSLCREGLMMERITDLPKIPPRSLYAHKGTFGKVLLVGGSRGMSGAIILSGCAALRSGAGLVQLTVPTGIQDIVSLGNPCYMTVGLAQDASGKLLPSAATEIEPIAQGASVLGIGPGLGQSSGMPLLLSKLLGLTRPVVVDADALNAIAQAPGDLFATRKAPTVLTPHPGEFARMVQSSTKEVQANRESFALAFAQSKKVILVLKGHGTLVTDGRRLYRNETGNPGMATGGSGDVLTGIISALIAQGMEAFAAAQLGVFLHGRAGDIASQDLGEISLNATDLIDSLPEAFLSLTRS
jgi:NAD(P)H-hydrate epimerase